MSRRAEEPLTGHAQHAMPICITCPPAAPCPPTPLRPLQMEEGSAQSAEELLGMQLQQNQALELGSLENGLRYVILPNRSPPARFETHLEIHAGSGGRQAGARAVVGALEPLAWGGTAASCTAEATRSGAPRSVRCTLCAGRGALVPLTRFPLLPLGCPVDEAEREQGIAHLVEHVTFLGSKKREGLLGTGARCATAAALLHVAAVDILRLPRRLLPRLLLPPRCRRELLPLHRVAAAAVPARASHPWPPCRRRCWTSGRVGAAAAARVTPSPPSSLLPAAPTPTPTSTTPCSTCTPHRSTATPGSRCCGRCAAQVSSAVHEGAGAHACVQRRTGRSKHWPCSGAPAPALPACCLGPNGRRLFPALFWPQVLDALTEVGFEPEFLPSRIEKERKAVVAEAQVRRGLVGAWTPRCYACGPLAQIQGIAVSRPSSARL